VIDVVEALCGFEERAACSDAERRAALWLHDDLVKRGYVAWVETIWVRPQWAWSLFWHAALGVAASLVATSAWIPAAIASGLLALSYALEVAGFGGLLRRGFVRRATQLVIVEPSQEDRIDLFVTASTDAPRSGVIFAERWRRFGTRLRPGPLWWVVILLLIIAVVAGIRGGGADGSVIGAVQFVPTLILLVAGAIGLDIALAKPSPGASDDASGVALALALHEELTNRPPRRLSAGLILAGAGDLFALGLQHYLRSEKRTPEKTVLLGIGPSGSGTPAWTSTHPQLIAAAGEARRVRLARPGMGRRLPALWVRAVGPRGVAPRARTEHDTPGAVDLAALDAVYDLALASVDALDSDLSRAKSTNQS
jgi:hypothetical protein